MYAFGASLILAVDSRLQALHRQTKFASPLLPEMSVDSKRLIETQLRCVSRHDVHWTLNV